MLNTWGEEGYAVVEFIAPSFHVVRHGWRKLDAFNQELHETGVDEVIGNICVNPELSWE